MKESTKDDFQYFVGMLMNDGKVTKERFISYFGKADYEELIKKEYVVVE